MSNIHTLNKTPLRVFLVGPMGVGKTTIGNHLAQSLGYEFIDSDREIETRTGADIPLIFELEGEDGFRKREESVIDELTQLDRVVLATGGGAVIRKINRQHLASRGTVIYLKASIDKLFERTLKDRNRPLLHTNNPRQKIAEILQAREPFYEEVADLSIDTGQYGVRETVRRLLKSLRSNQAATL